MYQYEGNDRITRHQEMRTQARTKERRHTQMHARKHAHMNTRKKDVETKNLQIRKIGAKKRNIEAKANGTRGRR